MVEYSERKRRRIIALYAEGLSIYNIANTMHMTVDVVKAYLARSGIDTSHRRSDYTSGKVLGTVKDSRGIKQYEV